MDQKISFFSASLCLRVLCVKCDLSAWSPDGHTLAYVSTTSHNTQLPVELRFTPGIPINTLEVLATGCGLSGSILLDLY